MPDPTKTRGFRNRNPGNIDFNPANKWLGQVGKEAGPNGRFCVFDSHENGIRALAALLTTYFDRHKLDTPAKIIGRWAPPNENDTGAYAAAIARALNVGVNEKIDLHSHGHMFGTVKAIIRHELGGVPYTDAQIDEGLRRFGLVRPAPTIAAAATTQTGRGALTVASFGGVAAAAQPVLGALGGLNPWLAALIVVVVLGAAAAWVLSKRMTDDRGAAIEPADAPDRVEAVEPQP